MSNRFTKYRQKNLALSKNKNVKVKRRSKKQPKRHRKIASHQAKMRALIKRLKLDRLR